MNAGIVRGRNRAAHLQGLKVPLHGSEAPLRLLALAFPLILFRSLEVRGRGFSRLKPEAALESSDVVRRILANFDHFNLWQGQIGRASCRERVVKKNKTIQAEIQRVGDTS